jgi:hypothetical protein
MIPFGTAFMILTDEQNGVLGQITADPIGPNPQLLAAFPGIHAITSVRQSGFTASLLQQTPLILANSFDVLIDNCSWKNLGVFPVAKDNQVYPKFKLPSIFSFLASVQSYDGKRSYPMLPFMVSHIPRRFSISAKLFENLALAANGRGIWDAQYDKVRFANMTVNRSIDAV